MSSNSITNRRTYLVNAQDFGNLVRNKLAEGHTLCVLGWKDSNHNNITRNLANAGKVVFVDLSGDNNLRSLPKNAIAIRTRFAGHDINDQLKKRGIPHHVHNVTPGQVKTLLEELQPSLMGIVAPAKPSDPVVTATTTAEETPLDVLEQRLLHGAEELDDFDRLAAAFMRQAETNRDGMVTSMQLGKILEKLELKATAQVLLRDGWVEGHVAEGNKRIGRYSAGSQMNERLQKHVASEEPTDPLDKAAWLLKQEPVYAAHIADLTAKLEYWKSQQARVDAAKELLARLGDV